MQVAQSRRTVNPFQLVRGFESLLSHLIINQVIAYAVAFCVERIGISMEIIVDIVFRSAIYVIGFYVGVRHERNKR